MNNNPETIKVAWNWYRTLRMFLGRLFHLNNNPVTTRIPDKTNPHSGRGLTRQDDRTKCRIPNPKAMMLK
jgi:hypothetical protein